MIAIIHFSLVLLIYLLTLTQGVPSEDEQRGKLIFSHIVSMRTTLQIGLALNSVLFPTV